MREFLFNFFSFPSSHFLFITIDSITLLWCFINTLLAIFLLYLLLIWSLYIIIFLTMTRLKHEFIYFLFIFFLLIKNTIFHNVDWKTICTNELNMKVVVVDFIILLEGEKLRAQYLRANVHTSAHNWKKWKAPKNAKNHKFFTSLFICWGESCVPPLSAG